MWNLQQLDKEFEYVGDDDDDDDDEFNITMNLFCSNVPLPQCRKKGAALVFTVMDHDYVFQNDFAGEVFMALRDIPGVDGDNVSGFEALHKVVLPLTQPSRKRKLF